MNASTGPVDAMASDQGPVPSCPAFVRRIRHRPPDAAEDFPADPIQLQATTHTGSPVFLKGPPGSGKSWAMIQRAKHLVCNLGVDPKRILLVTPAPHLARRIDSALAKIIPGPRPRVITPRDLGQEILADARACLGGNLPHRWMSAEEWRHLAEEMRAQLPPPETYYDPDISGWFLRAGYDAYLSSAPAHLSDWEKQLCGYFARECENLGCFTKHSLAPLVLSVFAMNPGFREEWAAQYQQVLIDEGQDIQAAEANVLIILARGRDVFTAFDQDQMIYGTFALPDGPLHHLAVTTPCLSLEIPVTYRLTEKVFTAAQSVLGYGDSPSQIKPRMARASKVPTLWRLTAPDPEQEAHEIWACVQSFRERGYALDDMAVFSPSQSIRKRLCDLAPYLTQEYDYDPEDHAVSPRGGAGRISGRLSVMPLLAAKGLEFRVVFIPGWDEGIIPAGDPHEARDIQGNRYEEQHLLYVAMTRARDHLVLTRARFRGCEGALMPTRASRYWRGLSGRVNVP